MALCVFCATVNYLYKENMSGYRTGTADSTERQLADPRRAPGRATVPPPISAFQRLINIRHGTAVVTSRTTLSFPASSWPVPPTSYVCEHLGYTALQTVASPGFGARGGGTKRNGLTVFIRLETHTI